MTRPVRTLDLAAAADLVRARTAAAVAARGRAEVVLPGGRGPRRLIAALRAIGLPGPTWRIHLADERCVPADDPRRNGPHLARSLGRAVLGPPADRPAPAAAAAWTDALAGTGPFDVVVLGLGADGHVASLFPGDPAGLEPDASDAVAVTAPDPGTPSRVTLSAARLARTGAVLLVVDGPDKDDAVAAVRAGADGGLPTSALGDAPRWLVDLRRP